MQEVGLNENDISAFFTPFHTDDTSHPLSHLLRITKTLSYFNHLIWQEFLAAIHMIYNINFVDFKKLCSNFNLINFKSSQYEIVTKFLFGLCNSRTVDILKSIDDNYFFLPNHHARFLKEYLRSHLKNVKIFSKSFRLATLLNELKDENLTREFSNLLPSVLSIDGDVFPNDVLPFCELIRARQLDLEIHLSNALFHKDSHLLFYKEMESIMSESPHIKVKNQFLFF